ncbi:MAG: helix-turn-helix transcriptional regulator [Actinophytocola sp.]|uniref:Scr1 family TA system antitoxin-like transcriptional regulator n=1 Tax=Actinophytocola sp. TaxID=1872138 RepID=UPI003C76E7E8
MAIGTTRGKRRLGRHLQPYLDRRGLKPADLAKELRTSEQTIKRLFKGDNLVNFHLFNAVLGALDLSPEEKHAAQELYDVADADISTIEHADSMQPKYRRFRLDESEAFRERSLDTVVIPGLLQTAAYAQSLSLSNRPGWKGKWDPEKAAAERRNRQAILTREDRPLQLEALVDERVLDLIVGGSEVMAEQYQHLLAMANLPNITIRLLAKDRGAYGAMSGPLFLLDFAEEDEPPSAYAENVLGLDVVEKPEDVSMLAAVWDGAASMAVSPEDSEEIIKQKTRRSP